ncbi:6-pyruvoyl trahydropterin synthase family protein [Staphylococcus edaphicus]|uniref:6-carboxy-5,6,7,8-tetrahydropterin synthase n=1 Tax=Staphylococcus edaphicus TaxID=1955013 RepID=A0A2C6WHE8_9STAP|nr:6-carboxytetrahydropterin synthase [Staphylococcus edaphicus]PHK48540.1 6-pyruvoyl tetrahydrobiopterin synthase [Staphylococcus edaphicus]UQW81848.1 6-carboxytetrahydropterin synthase [Staphylococcus edaphicus]
MSKLDHIQPPQRFRYRESEVLIKNYYEFTCDNRIYFTQTVHKDLENQKYKFNIEILSSINKYGLALDFNEVDKLYKKEIAPYIEGQIVNETLPDINTTAENIAIWIWDQFNQHLPENNTLQKLEFFETETQGLVLTADLMNR